MQSAIGEFVEELSRRLYRNAYNAVYQSCEDTYRNIFDSINRNVGEAATSIGQDIQSWNGGAFAIVRTVAENVIIPIGGMFIIILFCWELIHMLQESNQMKVVGPEQFLFLLMRFLICLIVFSKSFDIVMGLYTVGQYAASSLSATTTGTFGVGMQFENMIPRDPPVVELYDVFKLVGVMLVLMSAWGIATVCGLIIHFQITMWFIEMLVYAAPAAIPLSTFFNKEWGQVGMNYTRKMLALGFQGFFMILMVVIYGGIMNTGYSNNLTEMVTFMCGAGVVLAILILKSGKISESIFNAH